MAAAASKNTSIPSPSGTRDFYPLELARRRWIEDRWRTTSIRHGFDEIDGPTFEHTELYTVKSGEGILNEVFNVFSGKDEKQVAQAAAGKAPFALRPEFTPTLARMYAAKAAQLPKPCKWFWQQNCFRAERQQRGRLREFMQWNCDILGSDDRTTADAELIAVCVDLFEKLGLTPETVTVRYNDRNLIAAALADALPKDADMYRGFALLDKRAKLPAEKFAAEAAGLQLDVARFDAALANPAPGAFEAMLSSSGIDRWTRFDRSIVRGLAYYTGMVFEVIVDGERAVAGGGRYDNLIELFGGPATPAVGFGMGDVVLSLVLQDKGLMPTDAQIARDLGLRPDAFIISNGTPESDALVPHYLARLRQQGMHARRSYKATKNVGKLLTEAASANARYAVIIESATDITLKNMDANTQDKGPASELLGRIMPA